MVSDSGIIKQSIDEEVVRKVRVYIYSNANCGYSSAKRFVEDAILEKLEREQQKKEVEKL